MINDCKVSFADQTHSPTGHTPLLEKHQVRRGEPHPWVGGGGIASSLTCLLPGPAAWMAPPASLVAAQAEWCIEQQVCG